MSSGLLVIKNCSVAGLGVLVVLFMVAAPLSGQGSGTAFASVNVAERPAGVPARYAITPFGYFHPSCVLRVEEGETLLADGRVRHADGSVAANIPVCNYPHYSPKGAVVTEGLRDASGNKTPGIWGWLEYISATTDTWYGEISATWTVPPAPSTVEGQTLFFFPGFEDTIHNFSIVQPVLQWYPPGPWAIASWNCCMQGTVWNSLPKKVNPGDTILGTIKPACANAANVCQTWEIITKDETTGKRSILRKTPAKGQVWNWGFGAVVEVYGVRQCSDFPANAGVVFTVQLYDRNGALISDPGWMGTPADAGTTPYCNYGLNVTATEETVDY